MGGIGKTTLADVVFHRLSSEFEACCFLANVREESEKHGQNHLRNKLLREILKDRDLNIDTPSIGSTFTRERISRTKALIVLDDVNASSQLEFLVGDHDQFCRGSLIIITTRDRSLLEERVDDDKIYEVERLSPNEALQLFQSHAFKNKSPKADFSELSRKVVHYVKGIPLALKTLGPLFLPHKRIEDWEEELSKLKTFPNEEILSVLRHSYNGLEKNEREIFLDIACFYKGMDMDFVIKMIHLHGFYAVGIKVLIAKSLISISTSNCLEMHDMLQEMGWAIVREQCIEEPGKRDRLWDAEDVCHVLENNTGTATVRSISFHPTATTKLSGAAAFQNMYNLRLLKIYDPHLSSKRDFQRMDIEFNYINRMLKDYGLSFQLSLSLMFNNFDLSQGLESLPDALRYLHWLAYPLKSLPTKFSTKNLVELRMPCSKVVGQIWNKGQKLGNLKVIDLSYCKHLTEVPDLSGSSNLEHIDLCECTNLVQIPSYFQNFHKLTYLDLGGCLNLNYLPEMPVNIESLDLSKTAIKELPSSVWSLEKLCSLNVTHCKALEKLPSNSCNLKVSGTFSLNGCESLGEFSELPRYTSYLDLSETAIKELPSSLESLFGLTTIRLFACDSLLSLSTSIRKLKSLESLDLQLCSEFQYFPEILEPMEHLTSLSLSSTALKVLPSSIGNLIGLRKLDLHDCWHLEIVPNSIYNLSNLETLNFHGCRSLGKLPPVSVDQVRLLSLRELILAECSIKEIPDALVCLTSLCSLDLEDTEIKSIPASIKQAARLSCLRLTYCKSLEYLPELPPLLQCLEAGRCTSLKEVSSSRTALTQGWDVFSPPRLEEKRIFSGCPKLDENARSNIMADAQLRIMRMATASSKFKEEASYDSDDSNDEYEPDNRNELKELFYWGSFVAINCPGYEIPNWFSHQNEGSSINIKLPPDWFRTDFLGFALSVVVYSKNNAGWLDCGYKYIFDIGCKYNFKTSNGESHEINHPFYSPYPYVWTSVDSHELFVWWYNNVFQVVGGAEIPTAFYKLVTEASVDFSLKQDRRKPFPELEVVKCGICLLYAQDAEIIKQRNL
ncbi:disease resistance protein TAO1-like [Prunus avium]|uniref:ADP-ribosyl cyclase/cyclic ADP-ribose hydrolase n=1 Tax=Prunus avium TaxID=42229 RepID=A0A6P5U1Z6_PRUAV|nr:disease resistance protein TAO1-like [Prunus avium]